MTFTSSHTAAMCPPPMSSSDVFWVQAVIASDLTSAGKCHATLRGRKAGARSVLHHEVGRVIRLQPEGTDSSHRVWVPARIFQLLCFVWTTEVMHFTMPYKSLDLSVDTPFGSVSWLLGACSSLLSYGGFYRLSQW